MVNGKYKMAGHTALWRGMALLVLLAAAWPAVLQAAISVDTDRDPVSMNESFQITFTASGAVDGEPDFSPLGRDFQVLSTSQSSNFSVVNGDIQSSKSWTVTVLPKKTGKLEIPPIHFGADASPAASVNVTEAAASPQKQGDPSDIFLEAEVSTTEPYVQAQVLYTLRLYRAVATAGASLDDPAVKDGDAVIERIDSDNNYETRVNGRRYVVVERKYAVYPQNSGSVTIAPVKFEGQVAPDTFSLMDPFGPKPRTVVRQSAPVTLDVKPVPAAFSGRHWLPAKHVSLKEEWSSNPPAFKVGEPITRTLILAADGQTASQLPALPEWVPDDFRKYPDQPALKDDKSRNGIVGSREEKTALIPNQPGDYVLPAMTVPWWNTTTGKMEQATLPERHVTVTGAGGQASGSGSPGPANVKPAPLGGLEKPGGAATAPAAAPESGNGGAAETGAGFNPWLLLSLALAGIWLVTVLAWWWSSRRRGRRGQTGGGESLRQLRKELRQACLSHAPDRVKSLMLHWGRLYWPDDPPASLGDIGRRSHPALAAEIHRLNHALYGNTREDWRGEAFWQAFEHAAAQGGEGKEKDEGRLEPLYRI